MRWSGKWVLLSAAGISLLLVGVSLFWRKDSRRAANPPPAATVAEAASPETPALSRSPAPEEENEDNQREITLFFQSADGEELSPETRRIFVTPTVTEQARQAVRELVDGPKTSLFPTLPADAEVREIFLGPDGTAYVDFSRALVDDHPGGSAAEIATVFSLVDTLTFNFPEIRRVRILVEGEERDTLKEHLDLRRSYVADMSLVSRGTERR